MKILKYTTNKIIITIIRNCSTVSNSTKQYPKGPRFNPLWIVYNDLIKLYVILASARPCVLNQII